MRLLYITACGKVLHNHCCISLWYIYNGCMEEEMEQPIEELDRANWDAIQERELDYEEVVDDD